MHKVNENGLLIMLDEIYRKNNKKEIIFLLELVWWQEQTPDFSSKD